MKEFKEPLFREFEFTAENTQRGVIKSSRVVLKGKSRVTVEEESENGIQVILKKDENDTLTEIKFICSCGQTKSLVLDYTE